MQENFQLTRGDNAGWTQSLDNTWLVVPNHGTGTTKLTVNIPVSATGGTLDNIWVKATSKDNTAVFDNESCLAQVKVVGIHITATIDINPDTILSFDNWGRVEYCGWITCFIKLPKGYDVAKIDISSIRLNGVVPAEKWPTTHWNSWSPAIGYYRNDIPYLMVRFDKSAVVALLPEIFEVEWTKSWGHFEISVGKAKLTVTGLVNNVSFEGSDTIKVIWLKRTG